MIIGYARANHGSRAATEQVEALRRAGCDQIVHEKNGAMNLSQRLVLARAVSKMRREDLLVVATLDRVANDGSELQQLLEMLDRVGARLQSLDTSEQACLIDHDTRRILAVLNLTGRLQAAARLERQMKGIEDSARSGVRRGAKPKIDREKVISLRSKGMSPHEIARQVGAHRVTVHRILAQERGGATPPAEQGGVQPSLHDSADARSAAA